LNNASLKGKRAIENHQSIRRFEKNDKVVWFEYEEDQFYSKRESELIQQYLQVHGKMSGGGEDELDDLF